MFHKLNVLENYYSNLIIVCSMSPSRQGCPPTNGLINNYYYGYLPGHL